MKYRPAPDLCLRPEWTSDTATNSYHDAAPGSSTAICPTDVAAAKEKGAGLSGPVPFLKRTLRTKRHPRRPRIDYLYMLFIMPQLAGMTGTYSGGQVFTWGQERTAGPLSHEE